MGSDGFDDDFPRIFGRNEITLRSEIQQYVKERFVSKNKIKDKIEELYVVENNEAIEDIMNKNNYTIAEIIQMVLREILA